MENRLVRDLLLILAIYGLYWATLYMVTGYNLLTDLGVTPGQNMDGQQFRDAFYDWALVTMLGSLFAMLAWYAIGQWGMRSHSTSSGTWMLAWFVLLVVVLAVAFAASIMGPQVAEGKFILELFYFLGGAGFYYLASLVASPVDVKYVPPGSKLVRKGW